MEASGSIVVACPQKAVFEFVDVPENQARISPRLSAVETLGTVDNGAKRATYTYRLFGVNFDGEVRGIEHEPPETVTFEPTGDIEGHIRGAFAATDRGTRVTYTASYDLGFPPTPGTDCHQVQSARNRADARKPPGCGGNTAVIATPLPASLDVRPGGSRTAGRSVRYPDARRNHNGVGHKIEAGRHLLLVANTHRHRRDVFALAGPTVAAALPRE